MSFPSAPSLPSAPKLPSGPKTPEHLTFLQGSMVFLSIVFGVIGASLLLVGVFTLIRGNEFVTDEFREEKDRVLEIPESFEMQNVNPAPDDPLANVEDLLREPAILLSVVGGALLAVSLLGGLSIYYNYKQLLIVYAIVLAIVLFLQIVFVILLLTRKLDDRLKDAMKDSIKKAYGGIDAYNGESLGWNMLMIKLGCCGVEGYKDFDTTTQWDRTRDFSVNGTIETLTLLTPLTCCKFIDDTSVPVSQLCASAPSDINSNWKIGCYTCMENDILKKKYIIIGVSIGALVLQVLLLIAAFVMDYQNRHPKKKHDDEDDEDTDEESNEDDDEDDK